MRLARRREARDRLLAERSQLSMTSGEEYTSGAWLRRLFCKIGIGRTPERRPLNRRRGISLWRVSL